MARWPLGAWVTLTDEHHTLIMSWLDYAVFMFMMFLYYCDQKYFQKIWVVLIPYNLPLMSLVFIKSYKKNVLWVFCLFGLMAQSVLDLKETWAIYQLLPVNLLNPRKCEFLLGLWACARRLPGGLPYRHICFSFIALALTLGFLLYPETVCE